MAIFSGLLVVPGRTESVPPSTVADVVTNSLWLKLRSLPVGERPRVGLVLSGGGARGLAHIGVLKVFEREGVPVDLVVGTSVGAIVGALYAGGVPASEIEGMAAEVGWDQLTDLSSARVVRLLVSERLLSTKKMEKYLQDRIGNIQFADLQKEFACLATDIRTGEGIVLREGSVALAARASATMPGIFEPVPFRHRLLIDGGVVDNVPTEVARRLGAELLICLYVPADFSRHSVTNVLTMMTQALYIQGQVISEDQIKRADFVITPNVSEISALELWRSKECMEAGQRAAEIAWPELKRFLAEKFLEKHLALKTVGVSPVKK
ncbi:MAG: patatin-like phospholipase family protein [Elusimicrobia bacterium]|jgi:NTE family protein|nr:patatin-like phospholipase family protein [Elusimicrobiota bacterium]